MILLAPLASSSDQHGGKATGLRKILEIGLLTPLGVVLSADSVREMLSEQANGKAELLSWINAVDSPLAVRSSASVEDGLARSFAGVFETRTNVAPVIADVLKAIREVSSSSRTERARAYAGELDQHIPVILQKMVVSPIASGVTFTRSIGTDGWECAYTEWVEGYGEQLVGGRVTPYRVVIPWREDESLDRARTVLFGASLPPVQAGALWDALEVVHKRAPGDWDLEWSIGQDGVLWMLQMRPVTSTVLVPAWDGRASAVAASPGVAAGPARIVDGVDDLAEFRDGDVLIAEITEVDYIPALRRASAIVTEQGGVLSHAAIVARELGIPCVVGLTGARSLLSGGTPTTVDGTSGLVRQGTTVLGGRVSLDADLRTLSLYDRGLEVPAGGRSFYVEALPDGLVAYTADEIDTTERTTAEADLRRHFGRPVDVVPDQKLLWYWEWRRYNRLHTVTFLESRFRTAVARWDRDSLTQVTEVVLTLADETAGSVRESKIHDLYLRELGAALHALCGMAVEGMGTWEGIRDTLGWRKEAGVSFAEMLMAPAASYPERIERIRECLTVLADLRNNAFPRFSQTGAFTAEYFGDRSVLVEAVCREQGLDCQDESAALDILYGLPDYLRFDDHWMGRALALGE